MNIDRIRALRALVGKTTEGPLQRGYALNALEESAPELLAWAEDAWGKLRRQQFNEIVRKHNQEERP